MGVHFQAGMPPIRQAKKGGGKEDFSVAVIQDDLFNSPTGEDEWIAHQCNSVTRRAAHLSREVFG